MTPRRSRGRLLGSALLAAGLLATSLPTAASAYVGGGSFYPEFSTPVFPGSDPAVLKDGWKLTGAFPATQSLVAPRWILASGHMPMPSPDVQPMGYNSHLGTVTGGQAVVKKVFVPTQTFDEPNENLRVLDGSKAADISLTLLDRPMQAPQDGFPLLMSDPITSDLAGTLPGSVLWTGQGTDWIENYGSNNAIVHPKAGWTRPDGLPLGDEEPIKAVDGDSGSIGLWYPTASSRPVISSVSTSAETMPRWGKDSRFTAKLKPSETENYATIADWIKAKVAAERALDPTLDAPEWATLADVGAAPSTLVPPAPRNLRISEATPTSFTITWDHPTETRISRSGYRVRLGTDEPVELPADDTSYSFDSLTTGTEYTVSVKAFNDIGTSNVHRKLLGQGAAPEPDSVRFTPHVNPAAVADFTVTPAMAKRTVGSQTVLDYCATVEWTMPANGETVANFGGEEILQKREDQTIRDGEYGETAPLYVVADGRAKFRMCGLDPNTLYGVAAWNTWAPNPVGPTLMRTVRTPAGPAPGTVLGAATNVRVRTYRTITNDRADYCLRATWTAPSTVSDLPLRFVASGGADVSFEPTSTTGTEFVRCGIPAEQSAVFTVDTYYGDVQSATKTVWRDAVTNEPLMTPAGAPLGTPAPRPTNLSLTTAPANNAGTVDYCITATWQLAELAGFNRVDTAGAWNADYSSTAEAEVTTSGTSRTSKLCGLQPGTTYTVGAGVIYTNGSFVPYETTSTITTPSGAAPGTEWEAPTNLRVTQQIVNGQRCATLLWGAPAPVDGFPVLSYNAYLLSDDGEYSAIALSLSPLQGMKQFCGLPAGTPITATVQAKYRQTIVVDSSLAFTSNA